MRKLSSLLVICGALVAAVCFAKSASADEAKTAPAQVEAEASKAPETVVFDKAKLGVVKFMHATHLEKVGSCDVCHGGKNPIFPQEKTNLKMADMYAGKSCGACHDGKEHYGVKSVFAAKGACMKCHKKEAK